jgi:hypothetical protein
VQRGLDRIGVGAREAGEEVFQVGPKLAVVGLVVVTHPMTLPPRRPSASVSHALSVAVAMTIDAGLLGGR